MPCLRITPPPPLLGTGLTAICTQLVMQIKQIFYHRPLRVRSRFFFCINGSAAIFGDRRLWINGFAIERPMRRMLGGGDGLGGFGKYLHQSPQVRFIILETIFRFAIGVGAKYIVSAKAVTVHYYHNLFSNYKAMCFT